MNTKKDTTMVALLFLLPFLTFAALPVRTVVDTAVKKKRTQALVKYTEKNACGDSSDSCYIEEIHWLIDNGADVNAQMPNGEPIVRWSAKHGNLDIAQHLKRAGARPDAEAQRIIWHAYKSNLNDKLLAAMDSYSVPWIQKAITAGADVNFQNENGDTPLSTAIEGQYLEGVKFLISKGACIRAKHNGASLLSLALRHGGEPKMLSLLKTSGAPTNPTIELFLAVIYNRPNEVRKRLRTGVDVNTTNNDAQDSWTPLMWAASYGHLAVVRLLLRYDADPNIKDNEGGTALTCAQKSTDKPKERIALIAILKKAMTVQRKLRHAR